METQKKGPKASNSVSHSAATRCQAVLSVWTQSRKPAEVCREFSIKWMTLRQWQERAMEGMLQALEPRVNLEKGPALSPRLLSLIEKRAQAFRQTGTGSSRKLAERLLRSQSSKQEKTKEPAMVEKS